MKRIEEISLKEKHDNIIKIGYNEKDVIKMCKRTPQLYSYDITSMKNKIDHIKNHNYSEEQALNMTLVLPAIYGLSIDNINNKLDLYDSIGLHNLSIMDPKQLMQSVELSYARYNYFKNRGIEINMKTYKKLFISSKEFKYIYHIEKDDLLKMYPYDNVKEKIK